MAVLRISPLPACGERVRARGSDKLQPWRRWPPLAPALSSRLNVRRGRAFIAALIALVLFTAPHVLAQSKAPEEEPEQYPAGEHRDDTFYFCTACHGFKIVAQQGQSRERWSETFDVMVSRHGMVDVQGEQRGQMLDYLATAFPERRAPGGWKNPFER